MGFNRFTKNVLNISGLPDRVQNKATTLKALFDQAGVDIKDALNGLIAELEASTGAGNIGANVPTVTTKTVQAILTAFEESILDRYTKGEIDALVSGNTNNLVEDVDINLTTGVITVTKKDGTVEKYDTAIEKVPAKFEIAQSGNTYYLKITNVDGTSTQTDITKLMNIYEFNNTNDIAFTVEGTGNKKTVKANIRANSIGLDKLSVSVVSTLEGYMNSAKDSANSAKSSENSARNSAETARKAAEVASEGIEAGKTAVKKATEAESYAHGGTGTRENEDRDNAKYYSQVAKEVAGGNFVTVTEMEQYAEKKGTVTSFVGENYKGEEIELNTPLEVESILHISGNSIQDSEVSPDNPSEIRSVKSKSDNLFDMSKKKDNTTFVWSNGTEGENEGCILSDYIDISNIKHLSSNYQFHPAFYDANKTYLGNGTDVTTAYHNAVATIEIPKDLGIVYCRVAWKPTSIVATNPANMTTVTDIMLNKGTEVLPYQPYGYVAIEVKVIGENMFDMDSWTVFDKQEDGSYKSNIALRTNTAKFELDLPIDVYTLSYSIKADSSKDSRYRIILYYEDGTSTVASEYSTGEYISTSLTTENKKISYITFTYNLGAENTYLKDVMLCKGSTAKPYIPYDDKKISLPLGDIELRSTPDGTRDTFVRVDGVWNKAEYAPSTIFDGVNNKFDSKSGSTVNTIWMSTATYEVENRAIVMCNRFNGNSGDLYSRDGIGVYAENKRLKFAFGLNSELTTLELANEWLKNNPLKIVYPVKTPTYTPITDQTLISALDELEELILHKGYNYITVTAVNGVKAYLDLEIPATASVTNVVETDVPHELIIPAVTGEGDVKVKIPTENKMTINPATGEVNVKALKIDGVDITTFIEQVVAKLGN